MSVKKADLLHELLGDRLVVGGTLSQLANYSDLFSRMNEGVLLVDRNSYRVLEVNGSALKILKKTEDEVIGTELPELLQAKRFIETKLKGQPCDFEIDYRAQGGNEQVFKIAFTHLKILDYVEVYQVVIGDVTSERLAERELREMNAVLTKLSTTDEMTGLRNYRYFKEVLEAVHSEALKFNQPYGVIFMDVDHFKKFNDRNGHPAGDEVLRGVAKVLKSVSRTQDLPARYGGEEFVILCRHSTLEQVLELAELIRAKIQGTQFPFGDHQPLGFVSLSIGVACYPSHGLTAEQVLKNADLALYESKSNGRNQVTAFKTQQKKVS